MKDAYENKMTEIKQKRAPEIAKAHSEFDTITKNLGLVTYEVCSNEFCRSESGDGERCDDCVDKVPCAT